MQQSRHFIWTHCRLYRSVFYTTIYFRLTHTSVFLPSFPSSSRSLLCFLSQIATGDQFIDRDTHTAQETAVRPAESQGNRYIDTKAGLYLARKSCDRAWNGSNEQMKTEQKYNSQTYVTPSIDLNSFILSNLRPLEHPSHISLVSAFSHTPSLIVYITTTESQTQWLLPVQISHIIRGIVHPKMTICLLLCFLFIRFG